VQVDAAVASGELQVLTGVRGCTFLVAAEQGDLARHAWAERVGTMRTQLLRMGLDVAKLERLCDEVVAATDVGLEPAGIRARVGSIQPLDARRLGLTSTLPFALRVLEAEGRLTRLPATGRLDDERYIWRRASAPGRGLGDEPAAADAAVERVRLYLDGTAPTARSQVGAWLDVSAAASGRLLVAAGAGETPEGWRRDGPPRALDDDDEDVYFLPFRDTLVDLRSPAWVPTELHGTLVDGWGRAAAQLGAQPTLHHHVVIWRGQVAGIWDWDGGRIVAGFFGGEPPGFARAAEELEAWIAEELGDVFVYAQDGPTQRRKRVDAVRGLGGR
jgi:hypothetical protein